MLNIDTIRKLKGVSITEIADFLEVRTQTISDKIKGDYPFKFEETVKIQRKFFPEYDLIYLFSPIAETA